MLPRACEIILLTELPLGVDETPVKRSPSPHCPTEFQPPECVRLVSTMGGRYSVRWRLRQARPWLAEGHTASAHHLLALLGLLESSVRELEAKN